MMDGAAFLLALANWYDRSIKDAPSMINYPFLKAYPTVLFTAKEVPKINWFILVERAKRAKPLSTLVEINHSVRPYIFGEDAPV